jgi:hypothetical protein
MVFAEDIRRTILKIADERGAGVAFSPGDVATRVDKKNAPQLFDQVCLVASILIQEGKIDSLNDHDLSPGIPRYIKKR